MGISLIGITPWGKIMRSRNDYTDFRYRADAFLSGSIQEKSHDMLIAYNQERYGDAISMAKTILESTCAYVFHAATGKELAVEFGRKGHSDFTINMYDGAIHTLELFENQLPNFEKSRQIIRDAASLIASISDLRNDSSSNHGGRIRSNPPSEVEALLVMEISEDLTTTMLELLHRYKYPDKENVVGSFITPEPSMKPYSSNAKSRPNRYVIDDDVWNISFELIDGIIESITINFKKFELQTAIDSEFIWNHVSDYLPNDTEYERQISENEFQYYSNVHDKFYSILVQKLNIGMIITISAFEGSL